NGYGTWNAYRNEYWPAEYLIDRRGHVRHAHFGEGEYDKTESLIRTLLAERSVRLPRALNLVDRTPTGLITPESYLGYERLANYAGSPIKQDEPASYRLPLVLGLNQLAYGGSWRVELQQIVAGRGAALRLHFQARKVHLVLGGRGTVTVILNGKPLRTVAVTEDRLYTLISLPRIEEGRLELRFTPGVEGYAFTFG